VVKKDQFSVVITVVKKGQFLDGLSTVVKKRHFGVVITVVEKGHFLGDN